MDNIKFRKTSSIILMVLLISTLLLSGCHDTDNSVSDTNTEAVPANYAAGVEQATDEFLSIFSSFQNLEVIETSTMVRTDDNSLIDIQFTYTSDNGNGIYGFEYQKDNYGNYGLVRHGEDVTIDNLVNAE